MTMPPHIRREPTGRPSSGFAHRRIALVAPAAVTLAFALVGCAGSRLTSADLVLSSRAVDVPLGRAIVAPPPGGPAIIAVTERGYDNALSQEITLATRGGTPGQNTIYATFLASADLPDATGIEGAVLKEPTFGDPELMREMETRLPGVEMQPSTAFVQNKYGPFGYALGHGVGGETCLYAWQRLMPGERLFLPTRGAASVRIRLCDPAGTEASLLRVAYQYSINGSLRIPGWDPIGDAPPPPPNLGEAGSPIYPVAQPSIEDVVDTRPLPERRPEIHQTRRAPRRAPVREEAPPPPADERLEGFPVVPPPPAN